MLTNKRIFAIAHALYKKSMAVEEIHNVTKIDHWFLRCCETMVKTYNTVSTHSLKSLSKDLLLQAKQQPEKNLTSFNVSKMKSANCRNVTKRNIAVCAIVQNERFYKRQMSFVAHVLVPETHV